MTHGGAVGQAVDLFAGAGGWDVALRALGIDPLGIEWDDAACATRAAAGLRTLQADVAALDPLDFDPVELLIASAPCPTFSSAGNGGGRLLTDLIIRCLHELAAGDDTRAEHRQDAYEILRPIYWEREQEKARKKNREPDREKAERRARRDADMSLLVVEPLRWVLVLEPRWIALEQVPEVLGLWSEMAAILATLGYSTWTGVLCAEQYGVPQTRKRAILMADREAPVDAPRPSHQRYVKPPDEEEDGAPGLFDAPREVERIVRPEDRDLLPWVSMAEALGWMDGPEPPPSPTVSGGGTGGGGVEVFAGVAARKRARAAVELRANAQERASVRSVSEPAPTLVTTRRSDKGILVGRQLPEGEGRNVGGRNWGGGGPTPAERPATTVAGDPRLSSPTHHNHGEQNAHAIRVSEEEALILQSFPGDYPVQGTKSQRSLQIGNAVPPLLAHAILSASLAPVLEAERKVAA